MPYRPSPLPEPPSVYRRESSARTVAGFELDLDDAWSDRTIHAFESLSPDGAKRTLTVMRVDAPALVSIEAFAAGELASLARDLPDFELVVRRTVHLSVGTGVSAVVHWRSGREAVTQQLTMFRADGAMWNVTATSRRDDVGATALFERVVRGLARRRSSSPIAEPLPPGPAPVASWDAVLRRAW